MAKNKLNYEAIFPNESTEIIQSLLGKYNLKKEQEEKLTELIKTKNSSEKERIFEDLPGRKLARIVKEVSVGKIPPKNLPSQLQQRLNLSEEKSKQLTRELEEKVLILAEKILIDEETVFLKSEEPAAKIGTQKPITPQPKEEFKKSSRNDTYRETIE